MAVSVCSIRRSRGRTWRTSTLTPSSACSWARVYEALERKWTTYAVFVVLALMVRKDIGAGDRAARRVGGAQSLPADRAGHDRREHRLRAGGDVRGDAATDRRGDPRSWRIPFGGPRGLSPPRCATPHRSPTTSGPKGDLGTVGDDVAPRAPVPAQAEPWRRSAPSCCSPTCSAPSGTSSPSSPTQPDRRAGARDGHELRARSGATRRSLEPQGLARCRRRVRRAGGAPGRLPWAHSDPVHWGRHPVAVAAREIIERGPGRRRRVGAYRITPDIAYRDEIYQFPIPFRVVLYGPDISLENSRLVDRAERVEYLVLQVDKSPEDEADFAAIRDAFTRVDSNESGSCGTATQTCRPPPLQPPIPCRQRRPRTSRPGSAPVNRRSTTVSTPATNVRR